MDKHKRLFDLLPGGLRVKEMEWRRPDLVDPKVRDGALWTDWRLDGEDLDEDAAHPWIEHAARLHYEGEGYRFHPADTGNYEARHIRYTGTFWPSQRPLIDCLLAAAEHARNGGEGEK